MKIGNFDLNKRILLVAEIGNNHEGRYETAERMIKEAARCGVNAVKFQTFKTEQFVSRRDKSRFNRFQSFELSYQQFEKLSRVAHKEGVLFISTPLDMESFKFLDGIVQAFKIASGDNNFYPLLDRLSATGKPEIFSGGLATLEEIRSSKERITSTWSQRNINQELAILHCVTCYPVPDQEANLLAIHHLQRELNCAVGYSDHTLGIEAAVVSAALGARIIEKHFTLNKKQSDFRDHRISADPSEMALLVQRVRKVSKLLGSGEKVIQRCEKPMIQLVRRSIVAKRDLPAGKTIEWKDLMWTRPAEGLRPGQEDLVIGKVLRKSVPQGQPITMDNLRDK